MAKKTVYLENALKGLVEELNEKIQNKKQGDRLSIAAYYGNNEKLFRQSEINASVCRLYKESGVGLEQLPCGAIGSKIVFQIIGKEAFEKLFAIKESKSVKPDDEETVEEQTETVQAETVQAETVSEPKAEYNTVSVFEQVKALIPSLTAEEKQELVKLLQEA